MEARDLTPFFAPKSIAVVGAGERATSSGGAIMQMLQRARYGVTNTPASEIGLPPHHRRSAAGGEREGFRIRAVRCPA